MGEKNDGSRAIIIVSIISGVFGILAAIVTGIFSLKAADRAAEAQRVILTTNTALEQQVQSGNSTQSSLIQTVDAPTSTVLPPLVITATQQPIEQSTNTPSLPSFSDNFENGIKPDWKILYGNLGMADGKFTVISPLEGRQDYHLAILDSHTWSNFRIEVILAEFNPYQRCFPCDVSAASGIIIRHNTDGPSIALLLISARNQIAFATLDNSNNWSIIETTKAGDWHLNTVALYSHPNKIVIEAREDAYFAYIDGKQLTSATIPGSTSGQVGLWFSNSSNDNKLIAYAARYESFKVEELP